jgi:hypothetical protein
MQRETPSRPFASGLRPWHQQGGALVLFAALYAAYTHSIGCLKRVIDDPGNPLDAEDLVHA